MFRVPLIAVIMGSAYLYAEKGRSKKPTMMSSGLVDADANTVG